ncbi:MAG: bifunctional diguanylate cyclase/phosphodiesterase [Hyphomicrobiales bacterium]
MRQLSPIAGFAALAGLIGLAGYAFNENATTRMLEAEARLDARGWSEGLSHSIPDLGAIIAGMPPSQSTYNSLELVRRAGQVSSFRVYNAQGQLKLTSDGQTALQGMNQPVEVVDPEMAQALRQGREDTRIGHRAHDTDSRIHATAIVPVIGSSGIMGWIVADIDQSGRQALFSSMATKVSLAIGFFLMSACVLGFWYRNRERAMVEQRLEWLSQRDQLTGLINRGAFMKLAERKIADSAPKPPKSALIICEVTPLTGIESMLADDARDHMALLTAQRLTRFAAGRFEVARIGRLSFALWVDQAPDPVEVLGLAKEITGALSEQVAWRDNVCTLQACAGIALTSCDGETPADLMRSAEIALHTAQEQGGPGYGFFNPEIAKDMRRQAAVQRAVTHAVAHGGFQLNYQPVYNIRTGELNGFEALSRLNDAELGQVSPAEFIPAAEQMGLITTIGAWCLGEACRAAAEWPPHLVVAVNLSPSQFLSGSLINDVRHALERARLPAYRLEVEITEGTLLNDSELVLGQLRMLRDMGVAVSLDDFGTGYSSLGYLWKFPFSKLKIDRSFVQALDQTQTARSILRSIIKLGHGLGLTVTAEGIETQKQYTALRDLGCDLAQGFLLDRPASSTDLAAIILRNFAQGLTRRNRPAPAAGRTAA